MPENTSENTADQIVSCPKCGFQQPVDQYCAKCGIDMSRVPKRSAPFLKNPVFLMAMGVVAIGAAFVGVRSMRSHSEGGAEDSWSLNRIRSRPQLLKGSTTEEQRNTIVARSFDSAGTQSADHSEQSEPVATLAPPTDRPVLMNTANPPLSPSASQASDASSRSRHQEKSAPSAASPPAASSPAASIGLNFAWAEVSHEWLEAMGATEPGPHRVADLEVRLKESRGSYRVLEVQKKTVTSQLESFRLVHSGRAAVGFITHTVVDSADYGPVVSGAIEIRTRESLARTPASAAVTLERGSGYIVTLGPTGPATAAGQPPELVLLILPRLIPPRNSSAR